GFAAAQDMKQEPPKSNARFDRLKKLAGDWTTGGAEPATASFRVTAGGSAVVETLFAGTPHEMVTVYTADGDDVKLTHYCMLGNQPTLRAKGGPAAPETLHFECDGKVG